MLVFGKYGMSHVFSSFILILSFIFISPGKLLATEI